MSFDVPNSNNLNNLDKVRRTGGIDKLKDYFHAMLRDNTNEAVNLINDENLHFSSLFTLQPEIEKYGLYKRLNTRNQYALELSRKILGRKPSNVRTLPQDAKQTTHSALKWILETGCHNENRDQQLEEVLDIAALLLIKSYRDKTALQTIVDMLFERHRKDAFSYDLIWACFESRDPQVLILIANRFLSTGKKDVELAGKLLRFIPCKGKDSNMDPLQQYSCCMHWIYENYPFLYYTGESFQQSCNPIPYAASLEAKYLCKTVSAEDGKVLAPLTIEENNLLRSFKRLDSYNRVLLSNYSFLLYRKNPYHWKTWIRYPIGEQIRIAGGKGGGLR